LISESKHRSAELTSDMKLIIFSYLQHEKSRVILVAIAIKMNRSINSIERLLVTSTSWAMTTAILIARSSMMTCEIIDIASSWNTMSDLYRFYGETGDRSVDHEYSIINVMNDFIRTLNQRDETWSDKRDSRDEREDYREPCDARDLPAKC